MSSSQLCAFVMSQVTLSKRQAVVRTPCPDQLARVLEVDMLRRKLPGLACRTQLAFWQLP